MSQNNRALVVVSEQIANTTGGTGLNASIDVNDKFIIPRNPVWLSEPATATNKAPMARLIVCKVITASGEENYQPTMMYKGQFGRRDRKTSRIVFGDTDIAKLAVNATLGLFSKTFASKTIECREINANVSDYLYEKNRPVVDENGQNKYRDDVKAYQWDVNDTDDDTLSKVDAALAKFYAENGIVLDEPKSEEE